MRLRNAVLDLMRGAAGASLVLAVGCSGSEPIHQEPAATLAPLAAPPPAPAAAPPAVVLAPTPSVVVEPLPVVALAPVEPTPATAPPRRNRNRPPRLRHPNPGNDVMAACGRG